METNALLYTVIFTALIILLLVAGVTITIFVANRQRIRQEVAMAQMQLNYEKELRTVEQEVQEQVLVNLSRELHDNIGQLLTLMRLQLEQQKLDADDEARFAGLDETLNTTVQQLRMMSRTLNTDFIEHEGLINTIQVEIDRLRQINHLNIHWDHDNAEPELNKDQRIMSFRIFQEMLNNTLKHAKAKNIYITLRGRDAFLLSVRDDGQGYDVQQAMKNGGSGLRNIAKRAALSQLECSIQSEPGKGSSYEIKNI